MNGYEKERTRKTKKRKDYTDLVWWSLTADLVPFKKTHSLPNDNDWSLDLATEYDRNKN